MPIQVSCECGKQFQVGDQFAGKRGKCKSCGRVVTVPASAADEYELESLMPTGNEPQEAPPLPTPDLPPPPRQTKTPSTLAAGIPPLSKSRRKQNQPDAGGGIHISPGLVTLVAVAILIPVCIYVVKQGPVKADAKWEEIRPTAESNILSQLTRALHHEYRIGGLTVVNEDVLLHTTAKTISFDAPVIMFTLPDSIPIQGFTTEGRYTGVFHPNSLTFEADLEVFGGIHKVSGSTKDADQSLQMDGQPVNDW